MQLNRIIYYSLAALHVSSDFFARHQERLNCITASGITHVCRCRLVSWAFWNCRTVYYITMHGNVNIKRRCVLKFLRGTQSSVPNCRSECSSPVDLSDSYSPVGSVMQLHIMYSRHGQACLINAAFNIFCLFSLNLLSPVSLLLVIPPPSPPSPPSYSSPFLYPYRLLPFYSSFVLWAKSNLPFQWLSECFFVQSLGYFRQFIRLSLKLYFVFLFLFQYLLTISVFQILQCLMV